MNGRVLIVAGSDSGGGAGIQADIKTVTALGGYAATAITALTAQNTKGVHGISEVPPAFIRQQMQVVLRDIGADCVKTGMLYAPEVIEAVVDVLSEDAADVPLVVDPVMIAKGGASLLDDGAVDTVRNLLMPMATLITPNLPEAEVLSGLEIMGVADIYRAANVLRALGAKAVLITGGHLDGPTITDLLVSEAGTREFQSTRLDTPHTHGTGCTLASAVATGIAQGMDLESAVVRAGDYVRRAIETAPGLGSGHGPLNHAHPLERG